jgi:hypothetical protein
MEIAGLAVRAKQTESVAAVYLKVFMVHLTGLFRNC